MGNFFQNNNIMAQRTTKGAARSLANSGVRTGIFACDRERNRTTLLRHRGAEVKCRVRTLETTPKYRVRTYRAAFFGENIQLLWKFFRKKFKKYLHKVLQSEKTCDIMLMVRYHVGVG